MRPRSLYPGVHGRASLFLSSLLPSLALLVAAALPFGCDEEGGEKVPPPGELQAGVAVQRIPAPVGIGTVGYRGFGVSGPESPFNDIYPATTRLHAHPQFRALVISRGAPHEVIFLRADTVGIFQHFRRAVALELEARLGRSVDDALVFGGTHTHAGPGRLLDGGPVYELITDKFWPEFYDRMIHAAADTVMAAYDDLAPTRLGHTWAECPEGHNDRRCEDGLDYKNSSIPLVAVERDGEIHALLLAYAVHSTLLSMEDFTLSRETAGAIEQYVEASFGHPMTVLFFNSWGGDMSPASPEVDHRDGATQPDSYERMTEIGLTVAEAVQDVLPSLSWEQEPELFAEVHRVRLDREAIGYADNEFPYEWGGVYCQRPDEEDCDPSTTIDDLDGSCVPFPEDFGVPPQTELSAGRLGSLFFVTFPGEPGTLLAEELLRRLADDHGHDNVAFFGYSQDYTGYAVLEDDWWQGGYEASGAIWGPRQGEYLVDMAEATFVRTVVEGPRGPKDPDAPEPIEPFDVSSYDSYVTTPGEDVGTFVQDASPVYGVQDVVQVTVHGADPWLGTPVAALEDESGEPVLTLGGKPIDSDGYAFWISLEYDPPYEEQPDAATRRFRWTFFMPTQLTVSGLQPSLVGGTYQLRITVPDETGPVEITTAPFRVE